MLPPTISLILGAIAVCLALVGMTFNLPILSKAGTIAATAAVVAFFGYALVLLLRRRNDRREPDTRVFTYLRTFFANWLNGMSGSLSVPFAALAIWSSQQRQKFLWGSLAVIASLFSSYRVWRQERLSGYRASQQLTAKLSELTSAVAAHEARRSELTITPSEGARYILWPDGEVAHGPFVAGHFEFHLMVENTGRRNSLIDSYAIEIVELRRTFSNLQPAENVRTIRGRHCQHAMPQNQDLSNTGLIRIDAESSTERGMLLFCLPGLNMDEFVAAGLRMQGPEHKFGPLHCRLTLNDRTGSSATADFELPEA
jgi:hypothetical protein